MARAGGKQRTWPDNGPAGDSRGEDTSVARNPDILSMLRPVASLNLFPTENRMSPRALAALGVDAVHRYPTAVGPDYFYGDVQALDVIYARCEELAREFFGARWAFVPFLSGLHTMHTVLTALCGHGDRVLVMDPAGGGHYATATICSGFGYDVAFVPVDRKTCMIDVDRLSTLCAAVRPRVVYLDLSIVVRMPCISAIRLAVGEDALVCLDASHILGLLPGNDEGTGLDAGGSTCSGSTHKTFPGPQKGLFLTNDADIAEQLAARLPFAVSSAHANSIAALAITLEELMPYREAYAKQVVANARSLARALALAGFDVVGEEWGFTETHQVWVVPEPSGAGVEWGKRLLASAVRSTVVRLPATGEPGLRIGTQELTRLGMKEEDMEEVAHVLTRALLLHEDSEDVAAHAADLARRFDEVHYVATERGAGTMATAHQLKPA